MAAEPPAPAPLGARCARHPDVPAVALCARCGSFLCGECTELRDELAYCASCAALYRRNGPASRIVQGGIALGLAGLVCGPVSFALSGFFPPVFSMLSLALALTAARRELRRIEDGHAPPQGRTQARVALALGLVNGLPVLYWFAMLAFAFWGIVR